MSSKTTTTTTTKTWKSIDWKPASKSPKTRYISEKLSKQLTKYN